MKETERCPPRRKRGKELLHNVGSGELGLDVSERIVLDVIDPKLPAC